MPLIPALGGKGGSRPGLHVEQGPGQPGLGRDHLKTEPKIPKGLEDATEGLRSHHSHIHACTPPTPVY